MHQKQSIPCSILVLTRNSAGTLERCLQNLQAFKEILVHDANSEDETQTIAKRMGAKILPQYPNDVTPSVRVKDFTEMRLRQRADAAYDWVLYLDADEYMSDSLVEEIGEILKTASVKTIIKFPRLPVIDGRLRTHGIFFPEIMPRIHNRTGGCTLQKGKLVHEKYVYDETFPIVVTKNHLCVPTDAVRDLRSKDDRYLSLEVEKMKRDGYSWGHYFRWILFREPFIIVSLILRIIKNIPHYKNPNSVPFPHEWRYVRYHWRLFRAITGAKLKAALKR